MALAEEKQILDGYLEHSAHHHTNPRLMLSNTSEKRRASKSRLEAEICQEADTLQWIVVGRVEEEWGGCRRPFRMQDEKEICRRTHGEERADGGACWERAIAGLQLFGPKAIKSGIPALTALPKECRPVTVYRNTVGRQHYLRQPKRASVACF
ncbi:hypothetical protein K438DRAFT_1751250 [Mycena galopus ATCC 62051]|nr:hypothetical protein K438DRAFT_1751250 [Mycena galopus ATCC 62051]